MVTEDQRSAKASTVVGRQVRAAREMLQLSQADLARRLTDNGVRTHQATIARLERGERSISIDDAFAVFAVLGVEPQLLLSGAYTGEPIQVLPTHGPYSPTAMLFWLRGDKQLRGLDEEAYATVVPGRELHARLRRGVQHLRQCVNDYLDAVATKDRRAMAHAISDLRHELDRQEEDLNRLSEEEDHDG
jgi:transcriptional regulator with XRE-family HTH domain